MCRPFRSSFSLAEQASKQAARWMAFIMNTQQLEGCHQQSQKCSARKIWFSFEYQIKLCFGLWQSAIDQRNTCIFIDNVFVPNFSFDFLNKISSFEKIIGGDWTYVSQHDRWASVTLVLWRQLQIRKFGIFEMMKILTNNLFNVKCFICMLPIQ